MSVLKTIEEKVNLSIRASESQYCKLVLLVGEPGTGKTSIIHAIASEFGAPVHNINLEISKQLLELTTKQRILETSRFFNLIADSSTSILFLDNIEILFDKELKQDPLRLLRGLARNHTVVATWTGQVDGNRLTHCMTHRRGQFDFEIGDILIVRMDGTATIDSIEINTEDE